MIPGLVDPTAPPADPPGTGGRHALLEAAQETAVDLTAAILGRLGAELDECQATAAHLEALIRGQIGAELDSAAKPAGKLAGKIVEAVHEPLNGAYALAGTLGYEYPTMPEIAGDNAVRDVPGSVTLPLVPQPPGGGVGPVVPGGPGNLPCMPGYPTGLLPVFPAEQPPPTAHSPWQAQTGDPVCYPWQMSIFWFCDGPNNTPHPVIVGSLPTDSFWMSPTGQLTYGAPLGQGWTQVFPSNTVQYPADLSCPPTTPDPPGNPQPPGGQGCCIPADHLNLADSWDTRLTFIEPSNRPWVQGVAPTAPGIPGGTYHLWYVRDCSQTLAWHIPSLWLQVVVPIGFTPGLDGQGMLWFRPGEVDPALAGCVEGPTEFIHLVGVVDPGNPQPPVEPPGPVCAPPPDLVCPPPLQDPPAMNIAGGAGCSDLKAYVDAIGQTPEMFDALLGMQPGTVPGGTSIGGTVVRWLTGTAGPLIPTLVGRFAKALGRWNKHATKFAACNPASLATVSGAAAIMRFLNQWTGAVPVPVMRSLTQAENFSCQVEFPSPPDADNMYLASTIGKDTWECYQKAAGVRVPDAEENVFAKRNRANATAIVLLYRRKKIDEAKYKELMRREGFLTDPDRERFYTATEAWPHLDDVIRMMIRDVNNDKLMEKYQADNLLKENTEGTLMKYAEALGVTPEILKLYWRAHWHIPSYTQLGEMYHRYRYEDTPEELKTTLDDVRTALLYDDYMPWWVDRMVGIAHRPVTRIDAGRGYQLHVLDDDQLRRKFQTNGYTDEDAQMLLDIYKAKREYAENQRSGLPTPRTMTNQFAKGVLPERELRQQLEAIGLKDERLERAVTSAKIARSVRTRDLALGAVQKGYLNGLYSASEAEELISQYGAEPDAKAELMDLWTVQRRARGKVPAAAVLCKWRDRNMIDGAQHLVGLLRVGWSEADARRIVGACEADIAERNFDRQEKLKRAADREKARQEKLAKEREKLAGPLLAVPIGGAPAETVA
jgi:hypothetical protein